MLMEELQIPRLASESVTLLSGITIFLGHLHAYEIRIVIPTGAQRSGGTCCSFFQPKDPSEALPFPLSSRPQPRDLQFSRLVVEMFLDRVLMQVE
jgi:hypothetical protein